MSDATVAVIESNDKMIPVGGTYHEVIEGHHVFLRRLEDRRRYLALKPRMAYRVYSPDKKLVARGRDYDPSPCWGFDGPPLRAVLELLSMLYSIANSGDDDDPFVVSLKGWSESAEAEALDSEVTYQMGKRGWE